MKNKLFIFNFIEDILFFSLLLGNKLFFSKESQPPPEYQMVRPLENLFCRDVKQQEVLWRYSLECLQDHVVPQILEDLTCDLKELNID